MVVVDLRGLPPSLEGVTNPPSRIRPEDNILIGSNAILQYLQIGSIVTMYQWHELYALPVMKRPDGTWMSSISAIDEWIFRASELEARSRPFSRGSNDRAERALLLAQRRVDRLHAMGKLKDGPILTARDFKDSDDEPKRKTKTGTGEAGRESPEEEGS